jgi:hypothetical protein
VFTRALHWSLFWAWSIQSIPSHPISLRSILILSVTWRLETKSLHLIPSSVLLDLYLLRRLNNEIFSGYQPCQLVKNNRRFRARLSLMIGKEMVHEVSVIHRIY